ncbi:MULTISPECIES: ketol-acid reductoisomerase [Methanobacterium]|jgi:ketol-acid reductoisomerase|uniref:Ketol-acid reductoisomerase (NADP(+)) n=1 Tax=Methanobacterium formicicum TaxID=2162 RepID=A0A090I6C9_METFO|nr:MULTISPECIES: ketol-acid reductoisomerase [Methanobacterium]AIS30855.1 ketol-acid reductoisomerase IlvC [Methanobacterium formicicum]KUK75220.1 MAG: Ketol-acid reductoisomerase [Methanobacterium sp. 42_16]MDH2659576.1 ketol-acid reductoisomerase [Methanobacterium formicicum]CEA13675.1 Ketol-acid reductoisomerase [Methanobacterium formicicum]CEL26056.1 Ketol-acid reductoisomerase [Methanobacterium formicicum]
MKIYYEKDVNIDVLKDKTIAVIGYGSQGSAQAQNMAESGLNVVVGLRKGGNSWQTALDDGMKVLTMEEAAEVADVIHILIPDEIQAQVYEKSIKPGLKEGNTLSFSHGYNIHYQYIIPPENVNVTMIAPKGPGSTVRGQYLDGFGVPGLVAVHQDYTGNAHQVALAMGQGSGLTRAGVLETTFKEETETDLFGEQAVLCGGVTELIKAGFQTLVEAGYQPEVAYFETCHEVKLIVDLIYKKGFAGMWHDVSNTAEFGGLTRRERVITEESRKEMKEILKEIQNGKFAKEWALENQAGNPQLKRMRAIEDDLEIEKQGKKLRKLCGLEK